MIPHLSHGILLAATEAEANVSIVPAWVKLAITVGVFVIPYGLGVLIARQLKLKEYALKISVVLVAATLGLMPFVYQEIVDVFEQRRYEQQLAAWENAQEDATLQPEDIQEIKDANPRLNIDSPKPDQEEPPKISSSDE